MINTNILVCDIFKELYPIVIFGINKYLKSNAKNTICLLLRIAAFIRQYKLYKTTKDIPQISEFSFIAWDFLSAIYKFGWNKLIANKDQKSFRQYISAQFNRKSINNFVLNKKSKCKQASILAKLKFFQDN